MLSIYDPYDEVFYESPFREVPLVHLVSEIASELQWENEADQEANLKKAFDVCYHMHIPINRHFRKIFIFDAIGLTTDWLISDFGSYLLLINGNTQNYRVAKAQVYILDRDRVRA